MGEYAHVSAGYRAELHPVPRELPKRLDDAIYLLILRSDEERRILGLQEASGRGQLRHEESMGIELLDRIGLVCRLYYRKDKLHLHSFPLILP